MASAGIREVNRWYLKAKAIFSFKDCLCQKKRNFNCDAKPKCPISLWNCSNKSSGLATSYFETNPGLLFLYQLPSRSPFSEPLRGYHTSAMLQMIQNLATAFVGLLILCLPVAPALFYHCFTVKAKEIARYVWEWQPECRSHWGYFFRDCTRDKSKSSKLLQKLQYSPETWIYSNTIHQHKEVALNKAYLNALTFPESYCSGGSPFLLSNSKRGILWNSHNKDHKTFMCKISQKENIHERYEQGGGEQEQVICEDLEVVFMLLGTENSKHWTSPRKRIRKIIHFSLMGMVNLHKNNNFNFDFLNFEFNVEYREKHCHLNWNQFRKESMQFQKLCQDYLNYPSLIFEIKVWW